MGVIACPFLPLGGYQNLAHDSSNIACSEFTYVEQREHSGSFLSHLRFRSLQERQARATLRIARPAGVSSMWSSTTTAVDRAQYLDGHRFCFIIWQTMKEV